MTQRKIILIVVCALLACDCIIQGILANISPVKTIKTDLSPDTITIQSAAETTVLTAGANGWSINTDNYLATKSDVDAMLKALKEVKVLDKVGKIGNADYDARYNLTDEKAKTVTATKDGKQIAALRIGKASSTGSQTYATVNGAKDIVLVSGNLTSTFGKSAVELRAKTVYSIEENAVAAAQITMGAKTWGLQNTAKAGDKAVWALTGNVPAIELDQDAAQSWIRNVCFLNVNSWLDDSAALPPNKLTSFTLTTTSGETVFVDIYEKKAGDDTQYIGTCSRTPHKFDLTKYLTEKFTKDYEELKVKA